MLTKKQKSNILKTAKPANKLDPEINMAIYGKAGTGKTTLFSTFPGPRLLLDCSEKGTDSIRDTDTDVIRINSYEELEFIYWELKRGEHSYKSVAIDTVSHAQDLCVKHVLESLGKNYTQGSEGKWGSMRKQDWGEVATLMKNLILNFRDLPLKLCFIAHDRAFNMDEEDSNDLQPSIGPRLSPSVAATLNAAVSIIGNSFIKQEIKEEKVKLKNGKIKIKTSLTFEYYLRVGPHGIYTTKIRKPKKFQAPDAIKDPTYQKILSIVKGEE